MRVIRKGKDEDTDEDDLSPPPPPPGTPPPEAYQITAEGRYLYPVATMQPQPYHTGKYCIKISLSVYLIVFLKNNSIYRNVYIPLFQ